MPKKPLQGQASHFGQQPKAAKRTGPFQDQAVSQPAAPVLPGGDLTVPVLSFFPSALSFSAQSMDLYTGNGTVPPPGPLRNGGVPILITGVFPEGHRTKVTSGDAYTHLLLLDPSIALYDAYRGNGQTRLSAFDALAIPSGQTNNWWMVVFSFITSIPTIGRRRVVLADRFGAVGSWTTLV